mmetsp:Transcript_65717/g.154642  ORF Transcript_65717/g.154642 Transcript_65717/m.154642 type:complete len:266 (+) Transcript_65717:35-832(+)
MTSQRVACTYPGSVCQSYQRLYVQLFARTRSSARDRCADACRSRLVGSRYDSPRAAQSSYLSGAAAWRRAANSAPVGTLVWPKSTRRASAVPGAGPHGPAVDVGEAPGSGPALNWRTQGDGPSTDCAGACVLPSGHGMWQAMGVFAGAIGVLTGVRHDASKQALGVVAANPAMGEPLGKSLAGALQANCIDGEAPGHIRVDASPKCTGCPAAAAAAGEVPRAPWGRKTGRLPSIGAVLITLAFAGGIQCTSGFGVARVSCGIWCA